MAENLKSNPFAGLFPSLNDAAAVSLLSSTIDNETRTESTDSDKAGLQSCEISENYELLLLVVFDIAVKPSSKSKWKEATSHAKVYIDENTVEDVIFKRLMLTDLEARLTPPDKKASSHTVQREVITYLMECFGRLLNREYPKYGDLTKEAGELNVLVLRHIATALQEPDLFPENEIHAQFKSMFGITGPNGHIFVLPELLSTMRSDDGEIDEAAVTATFGPFLDFIAAEVSKATLLTVDVVWFTILCSFALFPDIGKFTILHSTPTDSNPRAYEDTLLGRLCSFSCLPKSPISRFEFFDKPLHNNTAFDERRIWSAVDDLTLKLRHAFYALIISSPEVRHLTLKWIGDCLHANASRGKLWNAQNEVLIETPPTVSDGFMLNLTIVLLRLCGPFYDPLMGRKNLKVDPTYCAAEATNEESARENGQHLPGMSLETCLVPTPEGDTRVHAKSFGYLTECFFMAQRALDLGYRVVLDKLFRTNQNLVSIQRLHTASRSFGAADASGAFQAIEERMEMEMTKYMSLKTSLLSPDSLKLASKFHGATAFWLMQVNVDIEDEEADSNMQRTSYAPRHNRCITLPLSNKVPHTLRCIPEFVVENTISFLCFLQRVSSNRLDKQSAWIREPDFIEPILTEIVALMESPQRLYNPHLRARLAEALETLLPTQDESTTGLQSSFGNLEKQMFFTLHPHGDRIVVSLLEVFVSIEMTGQSVQFEQKFNYRRPMYIIMAYLWNLPQHRNNFKKLAVEAEENMEAVKPPLFLRFVNLLINDAVFVLDEALTRMAQLKQMHQARENGEWSKLPRHLRSQQEIQLEQIGTIARFNNILGRETFNTLKMLTDEIQSIFCHPAMVDRIASMLNYLLLQFVGPKQRSLKVKDQEEYEFNPSILVMNICEIYCNLSDNENFVLAVSQDGRSYSPELFTAAENVLVRIGGTRLLSDLVDFAMKVKKAADTKKEEEEVLNNAPDEFLDPIMSTLMTDPVILPSSKITVDRQTIARHLLSDQTDPFNRSPLTMDRVISNTELRNQIEEWMKRKKQDNS